MLSMNYIWSDLQQIDMQLLILNYCYLLCFNYYSIKCCLFITAFIIIKLIDFKLLTRAMLFAFIIQKRIILILEKHLYFILIKYLADHCLIIEYQEILVEFKVFLKNLKRYLNAFNELYYQICSIKLYYHWFR